MRCFHCGAETELRIRRRPICASAECHHEANRLDGRLPLAKTHRDPYSYGEVMTDTERTKAQ